METVSQSSFWRFPVRLTLDDMIAYHRLSVKAQRKNQLIYYFLFIACVSFAAYAAVGLNLGTQMNAVLFWYSFLGANGLYYAAAYFYRKIYYRNLWPESSHVFHEKIMTFSAEGVFYEGPHVSSAFAWPIIKTVKRDGERLYLMLDTTQAFIVPDRCLPDGLSPQRFEQDLQVFRQGPAA